MYQKSKQKPETISVMNFILALVFHCFVFLILWGIGQFKMREKEVVIPIDLTVVVEENLDGKEDEPPPLERPKPTPPPPPEPPKQKLPEPKPEVKRPEPEAVEQIQVKTNIVKKVDPPKPPKVEPPKKSAEEIRQERIERMRQNVVDAPTPPRPIRDGKTGRKTLSDKEIAELLAKGYKAGRTEQLAANEKSMCIGFIKRALDDRWRVMSPSIGRAGTVHISIRFDRTGRIAMSSLAQSCGDSTSDAAAMQVVRSLGIIRGLTKNFLEEYSKETITILYRIENTR